MNFHTLLATIVVLTLLLASPSEAGIRCGFLSFLGNDRACRASCWIQGMHTGYCDADTHCNCGERSTDDVADGITKVIGNRTVQEYVTEKMQTFAQHVGRWNLSETVKELAPSRCKAAEIHDDHGCRDIGRLTGKCSVDMSSCECSADRVSAKQWATCLDDGVCSVYCQAKGKPRGVCVGEAGWDCRCGTAKDSDLADLQLADDGESASSFNA